MLLLNFGDYRIPPDKNVTNLRAGAACASRDSPRIPLQISNSLQSDSPLHSLLRVQSYAKTLRGHNCKDACAPLTQTPIQTPKLRS